MSNHHIYEQTNGINRAAQFAALTTLVIAACILTSILTYSVTSFYFAQFSAQASLSPMVYLLVVGGIMLKSLLTVAGHYKKIAKSDRVASLRSE